MKYGLRAQRHVALDGVRHAAARHVIGPVQCFVAGVQNDDDPPSVHCGAAEPHRVTDLEITEFRLTVLVDVAVRGDLVGRCAVGGLDAHRRAADSSYRARLAQPAEVVAARPAGTVKSLIAGVQDDYHLLPVDRGTAETHRVTDLKIAELGLTVLVNVTVRGDLVCGRSGSRFDRH